MLVLVLGGGIGTGRPLQDTQGRTLRKVLLEGSVLFITFVSSAAHLLLRGVFQLIAEKQEIMIEFSASQLEGMLQLYGWTRVGVSVKAWHLRQGMTSLTWGKGCRLRDEMVSIPL